MALELLANGDTEKVFRTNQEAVFHGRGIRGKLRSHLARTRLVTWLLGATLISPYNNYSNFIMVSRTNYLVYSDSFKNRIKFALNFHLLIVGVGYNSK